MIDENKKALLSYYISTGNQEEFMLTLRDAVQEVGVAQVAQRAGLTREGLYKILTKNGNPKLETLIAILDAIGLQLTWSKSMGTIGKNWDKYKS